MQEFANSPSLRNGIFDLLSSVKLATDANVKLLDYTYNYSKIMDYSAIIMVIIMLIMNLK